MIKEITLTTLDELEAIQVFYNALKHNNLLTRLGIKKFEIKRKPFNVLGRLKAIDYFDASDYSIKIELDDEKWRRN